jgi:hypothetical protein
VNPALLVVPTDLIVTLDTGPPGPHDEQVGAFDALQLDARLVDADALRLRQEGAYLDVAVFRLVAAEHLERVVSGEPRRCAAAVRGETG